MRILLLLILAYVPSILLAQIDSSWQSNITLRYENGIVPENAAKYTVKTAEMTLKKLSSTFVPRVAQKSIHKMTGVQFGTAAYKELDWGYIDGTILYSGSTIYPTLTLMGNGHLNIVKGLSVTSGVQFYQYSDKNKRSIISLGSTYYWGAWMGTYMIYRNDNNTYSQKIVTRRYLVSESDYMQLGIYYGYFEASNLLGSIDMFSSNTFQFAFHKTILKAIQIQISFSSVGTDSNDYTSRSANIMLGIKKTI